ncbi:MAG: hypothetical protein ACLTVV_17010 [Ruminococcus sp.]
MEKRLQLWSPVWGWLATKEGESVDLKGQDLVLYEAAIQEALEQEKLYYRKKSAPFNLMDYYDADDSVKEKVQNLDIQVKKEQDGLYVCASLALIEPLTQQELEAIQNFLSRQYEGGIFDTSRIRTYSVEEGEVVFDFSVDTKEKFSQKEVQCETQKKYEITSIAHPQFPWLHRIRALVEVSMKRFLKEPWVALWNMSKIFLRKEPAGSMTRQSVVNMRLWKEVQHCFRSLLPRVMPLVTGDCSDVSNECRRGNPAVFQRGEVWDMSSHSRICQDYCGKGNRRCTFDSRK